MIVIQFVKLLHACQSHRNEGGGALYSARPLLLSTYLLYMIQAQAFKMAVETFFQVYPPPRSYLASNVHEYRYVTVVWCLIH